MDNGIDPCASCVSLSSELLARTDRDSVDCPACGARLFRDEAAARRALDEHVREKVGSPPRTDVSDSAARAAPRPMDTRVARLLAKLAPEDRETVEETIRVERRWASIRQTIDELLRWGSAEEINENAARGRTNGSNWLRGVIGLVSAEMLAARPELRAFADAPLAVGPGHSGSVGDMSTVVPELARAAVSARTLARYDALSPEQRATADAIKRDGQGDRMIDRVLIHGSPAVRLTIDQRIGLDLAPSATIEAWLNKARSNDWGPLKLGAAFLGWRRLVDLDVAWRASEGE